jgi:hypothetical protein
MAGIIALVFGRSRTERAHRMSILECPECFSHRAVVLDCRPPKARCADCGTVYKIKTEKPLGSLALDEEEPNPPKKNGKHSKLPPTPAPPITDDDIGTLSAFINDALQQGEEGYRIAQREAARYARRFGFPNIEPQWLICTKWLMDWARGLIDTTGNTHQPLKLPNVPNIRGDTDTRLRARGTILWRTRFLANYAMTGCKILSCRKSKISPTTLYYHQKSDEEFARMIEEAKAYYVDLLHARASQRALEGDLEPVYWQGVVVGHIRKFDSRLQIEMLRAHMPGTFKTPGTGPINVDTGDKILVMTEELRAKLIALHREEIMDMPVDTPTAQDSDSSRVRDKS